MVFALTWLRQATPPLHKTTLTTGSDAVVSHGQAASNRYSKNFKRGRTKDTRNGRRKGSSEFSLFIDKKNTEMLFSANVQQYIRLSCTLTVKTQDFISIASIVRKVYCCTPVHGRSQDF